MKTACFHTAGDHPNAIAICRYLPRWKPFTGPRYRPLAPSSTMLKLHGAEFEAAYAAQLAALDPHQVYIDLVALAGVDALLLCHEKPGVPCHRLTVARWLEAALRIEIPELEAPIVTASSSERRSTLNPRPPLDDPEALDLYVRRQLRLI